jgi:hypothetical protein
MSANESLPLTRMARRNSSNRAAAIKKPTNTTLLRDVGRSQPTYFRVLSNMKRRFPLLRFSRLSFRCRYSCFPLLS